MPTTVNGNNGVDKVVDGSIQPTDLAQPLTLGTAQNTTAGTSIDFTGIPSWVKKITITIVGVSTTGSSPVMIQLGTSGGIQAAGYLGSVGGSTAAQYSTGFHLIGTSAATVVLHGGITLALHDPSTNTWAAFGATGRSDSAQGYTMGGSKALTTTLDRIRLTTIGGTDTFDAGSVNIMYEG